MKIKIVSDSSCDLSSLEGVSFTTVPLKIITNDREYLDNELLNVSEMIKELREYKGRSRTSCPNVQEWKDAFESADEIFAITITSSLSGSYNAAVAAKKLWEEENPKKRIHVFDTLSAGPEIALIIEKLRDLIVQGEDFDSISKKVTEYQKRTHLLFSLESMHNFAQNGRVNKIVASAAGVMGIRILGTASQEGTLEIIKKTRGRSKAIATFLPEMKSRGYCGGKVNIGHCFNEEGAKELATIILSQFQDAEVNIYPMRGLCCYYAEKGGILVGFEGKEVR